MLFFFIFFSLGGQKLPQLQNLRSNFVVFFLEGQNRNFEKVRGRKPLLSLLIKNIAIYNEKLSHESFTTDCSLNIFIKPYPTTSLFSAPEEI